jgi:hypothetical protein
MAKKVTKKKTTKKKAESDMVAMKVEDMKLMEEAINLLARMAANPPRNQADIDKMLKELSNNDIAMEAFRIQVGA